MLLIPKKLDFIYSSDDIVIYNNVFYQGSMAS